MKKIFAVLSFVLVALLMVGCSGNNSAQVRMSSQKLTNGLNQIIKLTNNLDNIDTSQIDLSSVLSTNQTANFSKSLDFENRNFFATKNSPTNSFASESFKTLQKVDNTPLYDERHRDRTPIDFMQNAPMQKNVRAGGGELYSSLSTIANDCQNLNIEFVSAKANVLKNCSEAKASLKKLKDSKKGLTETELRTLTSYYDVVKNVVDNIRSCKSCSANIKNINGKKNNLASNSGVLNSEFLQIYNNLDSTCCTLNNAVYCVDQINCFVKNLNGENCDATTSVNPYIRNNRYLSASTKRNRYLPSSIDSEKYHPSQIRRQPAPHSTQKAINMGHLNHSA